MTNTKPIYTKNNILKCIIKSIPFWFLFVSYFCVNCGSDKLEMWRIQWNFKNKIDSSNILQSPQFSIEVNHYLNSATIENNFFALDSSCLHAQISMQGSKEYVDEFPNSAILNVRLWFGTDTVFDTSFNFNELDFDNKNVSYKTFYISVPDD